MSNSIQQSTSNALAADGRTLNALKMQAGSTPASIKEAAKQFESLFMRELIKSMREATMKSGMLDSPGGDLGADLLDQQFAVQMSGQPGGLSDLIAKQLTQQMSATNPGGGTNSPATTELGKPATPLGPPAPIGKGTATLSQTNFVQRHSDAAAKVERDSGIPASYMLGQAGHETGWGRAQIKTADGANSFNLFGIKAGANWTGKVATVTTTEFVNGVPQKTVAKFRAYDSYEDSFRDYANLINNNPRYAQARQQTGSSYAYASGLQKAGYATDPEYATKLSRAINATLRVQRAQA
jgi:peptidoglycan hydrolase FlgJ